MFKETPTSERIKTVENRSYSSSPVVAAVQQNVRLQDDALAVHDRTEQRPLQQAEIKIIDYSDSRLETNEVNEGEISDFLKHSSKPAWAACRWIYVNGFNPDVVRSLGEHKGLHHLTIEDVLDPDTPTKVDWYHDYCYVVLALHKLVRLDRRHTSSRSSDQTDIAELLHGTSEDRVQWRTLSHDNFGVSTEEVSVFLTSDNTVITIFERSGKDVLEPILNRLNSAQTILRTSNDPSMLLQAVIDTTVDLAAPVEKAVAAAFSHLEQAVLTRPSIGQSKQLYVLRSGLSHLMENIVAIGSVVKVLAEHSTLSNAVAPSQQTPTPPTSPRDAAARAGITVSPLAQVYLRDVQDHINTLLSSTRMAIRSAENLTSLIFNTIAASQNESVRQLTLVSSFFLPLTFLTGYFGMNFDPMPIVNNNSDTVFWILATPVMLLTLTVLGIRTGTFRRLFRRRKTPRLDSFPRPR